MKKTIGTLLLITVLWSCKDDVNKTEVSITDETPVKVEKTAMQMNLDKYVSVKLTSNLDVLTAKERQMLPILIKAADKMNALFAYEAYGDLDALLENTADQDTKQYIKINYGPWDRLANNEPFIDGVGEKPKGANFYPTDMTKEEFEKATLKDKSSLYNFVRRDNKGKLYTVPYHEQFEKEVKEVSTLLLAAADLAEDKGLKNYLELRAKALLRR